MATVRRGTWVVALVVGIAMVGSASRANAETTSPCRIDPFTAPPPPEYSHLGLLAQAGPAPATEQSLGPQFGGFWLQPRDLGWYIGVAPGALSVATVREQLLAYIDAHYTGSDRALLRDRLHVVPQPYGWPELRAVQEDLVARVVAAKLGVGWVIGKGCRYSDTFRVQFELFDDSSAAIVARARELAAPFGDRVVVAKVPGGPPQTNAGTGISRSPISALVTMPRCVRRGRAVLRVRRSARRRIARLSVTTKGHRAVFKGRRLTRPIRVKVGRGTRRLKVAVRLRTGELVSTSWRIKRCRG